MIRGAWQSPSDDAQPACADPINLPLVDAAFDRPGGPEADLMKRYLCAYCPIAEACLRHAMTIGEAGVWGGTGPNMRTRHGAPSRRRPAA